METKETVNTQFYNLVDIYPNQLKVVQKHHLSSSLEYYYKYFTNHESFTHKYVRKFVVENYRIKRRTFLVLQFSNNRFFEQFILLFVRSYCINECCNRHTNDLRELED